MKKLTAVAVLAVALCGCASTQDHNAMAPFNAHEIQCDVTGLHTLASDSPEFLSALRGYGDITGRRSVLAN